MVVELLLVLYSGICLLFAIIWGMIKLMMGESICIMLTPIIWCELDGLRVVPRVILTGIVGIFEAPGEALALWLTAIVYVVGGIFYIFPLLCCKDRGQVIESWRDHWTTNPFEFVG